LLCENRVDISECVNQTLHDFAERRGPFDEIGFDSLDPVVQRPDRGRWTFGCDFRAGEDW
jgi:hypothetical protein